jgi:hypothetical protein
MTAAHYWKEFHRLKVHVCYMELQLCETEEIDRAVKIFLAITSSASIGGWVIWKDLGMLWGCLIAGSQVVNAVRQYLPYKERLKSYAGLLSELEELVVHVESKWLDIAAGELTEPEIRKALLDLRTRRMKAFKKHVPATTIPENSKLFALAEAKAWSYFQNIYGEDQLQ